MSTIPNAAERRRLAELVNVNEQYLYQCLTGRRDMGPIEARRVERESGGQLRPWQVCQKTWRGIWPEMASDPDAPRDGTESVAEPPDERKADLGPAARRDAQASREG